MVTPTNPAPTWVRHRSGLTIPLGAQYPGLRPLMGSQPAGILSDLRGVIIVDDLTAKSQQVSLPAAGITPGSTGQGQTSGSGSSNPNLPPVTVPPSTLPNNVGSPYNWCWPAPSGSQTWLNNTGYHYYKIVVLPGYAVTIDGIYVTFKTGSGAVTTGIICEYGAYVLDSVVDLTAGLPYENDANLLWSVSTSVNAATGTEYYCISEKNRAKVQVGETNRAAFLSTVVRTLWLESQIPEHLIFGGGGFGIVFLTAVGANGGLSEVTVSVRGRGWKV